VSWGVAALGGELAVDERDRGGTAVRVRLPRDGSVAGRPSALDDAQAVNLAGS
jgi:signal transduction histidine kinase